MDSELEVAQARLGRVVGERWLLERVLGTGGMGAVYAARAGDGSVAAVKILHPEMSARREVRERFLREGAAADKIGHPGVVRVVGQGDGAEAFLAMELLEGETLRDRVRRHGRLPLAEVLDMAAQVLDVLVVAHERGVVHRDLKPDNLFVGLDGRIKVLDFGLARLLDDIPGRHQTRTGVALGTLAYMAPEQALGRRNEIDGRVDLFALGATLFRVLSGRRVHEAESEAELLMAMASRPAPPLTSLAPDVPGGVASIVDLALAFARDARYPDARTMLADVAAVRHGGVPPYASARLASRDERTRPERAAFVARTQPLEVAQQPASQRTVPLAAYIEPTQPYGGAPGPPSAVPDTAPYPVLPPASDRTEPLARIPDPAARAFVASAPAPVSAPRRAVWPFIVLGVVVLAAIAGLAVASLGSSSSTAELASTVALPAPLPSPEAKPPEAATRAALTAQPSAALNERGTQPTHPSSRNTGNSAASSEPKASAAATPTASAAPSPALAPPDPAPSGAATATPTATAVPPSPSVPDAGAPAHFRRHGRKR